MYVVVFSVAATRFADTLSNRVADIRSLSRSGTWSLHTLRHRSRRSAILVFGRLPSTHVREWRDVASARARARSNENDHLIIHILTPLNAALCYFHGADSSFYALSLSLPLSPCRFLSLFLLLVRFASIFGRAVRVACQTAWIAARLADAVSVCCDQQLHLVSIQSA